MGTKPTESGRFSPSRPPRFWQALTVLLLVLGYSGYYLCRSNLSVAAPLLEKEPAFQGVAPGDAKVWIGRVATWGVLAYAFGKFLGGAAGDRFGGRPNFLGGMAGAVLCTVLFGLAGAFPVFTLAWMANRLAQSFGWSGMVKIAGRWFDYTAHGTVLAVLSLSFLFGDAAARAFMGLLIGRGLGWRGLFLIDAGVLAGLFLLCLALLRESPRSLGAPEGAANPLNLYGAADDARPASVGAVLGPLLRSPAFWCVCLLALALNFLRETFNTWNPSYFVEAVGVSPSDGAYLSAGFVFLGGCSVLLAGVGGDRLSRTGRAAILCAGLVATGLALASLPLIDPHQAYLAAETAVLLVGFLLLGPYSYLAGVLALDFGGKRGGATAAGFIDGVGYLGGALSGEGVARVVQAQGWPTAFGAMAGVALAAAALAALFWAFQARSPSGRKADS